MFKSARVRSLLLDADRPASEIARLAGVHRSEVYRISKQMRRPVGQIPQLQAHLTTLNGELSGLRSKISGQDLAIEQLMDRVCAVIMRLDRIESERA